MSQHAKQTVITNIGKIVSGDMQRGIIPGDTILIEKGRIAKIGSHGEVAANGSAMTIDANGLVVIPGLIDAHTHPAYAGYRHLMQVECDLRSIAEIQAAVRERAARTPAGEWVVGFKYDDTKTAEGRPLTRADLDAAAPAHPVYVEHRGGHPAFVNSLALDRGGVSEATPDPAGGRFDRDPASGRLMGRLVETGRPAARQPGRADHPPAGPACHAG